MPKYCARNGGVKGSGDWTGRVQTADAVHLATAVVSGADRFITNNSSDFPKTITEVQVTYPNELPDA